MTEWRKSSYSGGLNDDACVEVARIGRSVGVRDSKNPEVGRLEVAPVGFAGLLARVKRGEFEPR